MISGVDVACRVAVPIELPSLRIVATPPFMNTKLGVRAAGFSIGNRSPVVVSRKLSIGERDLRSPLIFAVNVE